MRKPAPRRDEKASAASSNELSGTQTDERTQVDRTKEVNRREFLSTAGKVIAGSSLAYASLRAGTASAAAASQPAVAAEDRPNFILITTDQERNPQHWPAGWAEANLPARQRLSANGLTFRRHFCSATMCSPSRSTLFTGLHPAQHGVVHTLTEGGTFSPSEPTLPVEIQTMGKMLGTAGYNVVFKGKWHLSKGDDGGDPTTEQVEAYGFNDWEPTSVANDTKVSNFGGGCANLDEGIAESAAQFLATQSAATTATNPFMLIVNLGNPHDVLSYPQTWDEVEADDCNNYADFDFDQGISLPATVTEDLSTKPTVQKQARNASELAIGPLLTPQQWTRYANFYAGLVKEVDQHIGAILDAIPSDISDNTIVIFTSDHGEMAMSHGQLRQKAFQVYEETVNVPLIIYNPALFPEAQETDAYAALIDMMPTIATLAKVPDAASYTFMGTDLSPLLSAPDQPVQDEILFTFDDIYAANPDGPIVNPITQEEVLGDPKNIRAIFTQDDDGEWKYARYFDINGVEADQIEMYQLTDGSGVPVDPNETENLANESNAMFDDAIIAAKRMELAQRLAVLEAERLLPLGESRLYMPILQSPNTD